MTLTLGFLLLYCFTGISDCLNDSISVSPSSLILELNQKLSPATTSLTSYIHIATREKRFSNISQKQTTLTISRNHDKEKPTVISHLHDTKTMGSGVSRRTNDNTETIKLTSTLSSAISLSLPSIVVKKTCKNTPLGWRNCTLFTSEHCKDILHTKNKTAVPCNEGDGKLEEKIGKFFKLMKQFGDNGNCLKSVRWYFCALIRPECNGTRMLYKLPCTEACSKIKNNICKDTWENVLVIYDTIFDATISPSNCSVLPREKTGLCWYPQFIKDMTERTNKRAKATASIIGGTLGGFLFLLLFIVIVAITRQKRQNSIQRTMSLHEVKEIHTISEKVEENYNSLKPGTVNPKYTSLGSLVDALGITLFSKNNIQFLQDLGEGAFGKVVKCRTQNIQHSMRVDMVAVKYLKENAESELAITFQRELEILSNFNHPNVIPLVGVCLDDPMCIILEFMKYGDLNEYIRLRSGSYHAIAGGCGDLPDGVEFQVPELSYNNLLYLTSQIADGVSYLASKRFVHRDIATRNILVGEDMKVKISDFGLAHDIYGSDYYRVNSQKMLPLRWLAPEALTLGKFTIYSDIYAFGVMMWEIFTYGMQPFYGSSNEEVCQKIRCHKLLERPYCCHQNIYALMKVCWKFEPRQRKDCSFIRDTIKAWLQQEEPFIQESWKRLMLPPLSERRPTILKSKKFNRIIKREITL